MLRESEVRRESDVPGRLSFHNVLSKPVTAAAADTSAVITVVLLLLRLLL